MPFLSLYSWEKIHWAVADALPVDLSSEHGKKPSQISYIFAILCRQRRSQPRTQALCSRAARGKSLGTRLRRSITHWYDLLKLKVNISFIVVYMKNINVYQFHSILTPPSPRNMAWCLGRLTATRCLAFIVETLSIFKRATPAFIIRA